MRVLVVLILFSISVSTFTFSKTGVGELLTQLKSASTDSTKINILHQLGTHYQREKYDSALYYLDIALHIARQNDMTYQNAYLLLTKANVISYQGKYHQSIDTVKKAIQHYRQIDELEGIANAYNSIGVNYYNLSEYDSCRAYWLKSGSIYKQINDSLGLATNYTNLGVVAYVQGHSEEALQNFIKSLEIRKAKNHKKGLASIYMKIALIYDNKLSKPEKAYNYLLKAVSLYENQNDNLGKAKALTNLSAIYEQLDSLKQFRKTLEEARTIAEKIGNKRLLGTIYSNIGRNFQNYNELDSALNYFYKTLDIYQELDQQRELTSLYYNMGEIFFELADYETAEAYLKSSLEIARKIIIFSYQVHALQYLATIYERKGNYKRAYNYHQQYATAKDTLAEIEKAERLEKLEARFAGEQKEHRIQMLEKQQQLKDAKLERVSTTQRYSFIIGGLILVLAILLLQKYRQKTRLNKKLQDRNKLVKQKNNEIRTQAGNLKEFNKLLVEKNELIEHQKEVLEDENQKKDRFFSIIGHDLRSPMSSIQTSIQLLQSKKLSEERRKRLFQLIENDIIASVNLLENLLMWAKSEDDKLSINIQNQSIEPLILEAIGSVEGMAINKGVEIQFSNHAGLNAYFDERMIATVLRNLLSNAIKFSPKDSKIKVFVQTQNNLIAISVKDQGIGMDPDTIRTVIDSNAFYTKKGTQKERGSGLGLNLCIDFVKQNGGNLTIESEPDKGSVVTFTLPSKL
mgnify:CR=1 FL=1